MTTKADREFENSLNEMYIQLRRSGLTHEQIKAGQEKEGERILEEVLQLHQSMFSRYPVLRSVIESFDIDERIRAENWVKYKDIKIAPSVPPPGELVLWELSDRPPGRKEEIRGAIDSVITDKNVDMDDFSCALDIWWNCNDRWYNPKLPTNDMLNRSMAIEYDQNIDLPFLYALLRGFDQSMVQFYWAERANVQSQSILFNVNLEQELSVQHEKGIQFIAACLVSSPEEFFPEFNTSLRPTLDQFYRTENIFERIVSCVIKYAGLYYATSSDLMSFFIKCIESWPSDKRSALRCFLETQGSLESLHENEITARKLTDEHLRMIKNRIDTVG